MAEKKGNNGHDRIYELLMKDDEITWQSIIHDLVKTEQMDPWDVNVSLLAQKYLERIKQMEELNFFVSGKVILASAILLKLKSNKFLLHHIAEFDNLLYPPEDGLGEPEELIGPEVPHYLSNKDLRLTVRTPQPRKRKVSVSDLVDALKKALDVENRKIMRVLQRDSIPENLKIPEKRIDMNALVKGIYGKIMIYFEKNKADMTFSGLVPSDRREDKIITFLPLLHLDTQHKIILNQPEHFKEIYIKLIEGGLNN